MGQVFKARHRHLGRIVALKLIRKDRLDRPDLIKRFQREVRAAAALSHPHIVHAFDADQIEGTHVLVMEYVEGAADLARLLKKSGPLPVEQACEFIRQAALGLQHAYERGLVHRDIKPANLLLTADGKVIKILDMGLARLERPGADNEQSSMITHEGSVMGTPDYIAPEQAMESHTVDIRADLYSLGCTFYHLLTGRVPFPGGALLEKLLKHRLNEPTPVEEARPEVPAEVVAVMRKMMAKKPEDRFQTPLEVAEVLAGVLGSAAETSATGQTIADFGQARMISADDTIASPWASMERGDTEIADRRHRKADDWLWLKYSAVGGLGVVAGFVVLLFLLFHESNDVKRPVREAAPPVIAVPVVKKTNPKVDDAWLKSVAALPAEKQVETVVQKLKELNPDFDGKVTHTIQNGVVAQLQWRTSNIADIRPLKALAGLTALGCEGTDGMDGKIADLSPLKGLPLTFLALNGNLKIWDLSPLRGMPLGTLEIGFTSVNDLSPLQGMPLTSFRMHNCGVRDLSPLKGMRLEYLGFGGWDSQINDLSPLRGMPLKFLGFSYSQVNDLSPLESMPIYRLSCDHTRVSDLSPIKKLPIEELACDFSPWRDTEIIRSVKTLKRINGKPAAEFWKEVDAKQAAFDDWCKKVAVMSREKQVEAVAVKLKELNPAFDGKVTHKIENGVVTELQFLTDNATDISPVRALPGLKNLACYGSAPGKSKLSDLWALKGVCLVSLQFSGTDVSDLSPLKGMPLTMLNFGFTRVSDLSPLKGMRLRETLFWGTQVSEITPLSGMPLTILDCGATKVSNLGPLKGMPLMSLKCLSTLVSDLSPLKGVPLKELWCDFKPERDAEILRSIKTLETINGKPPAEFWKEVDAAMIQAQAAEAGLKTLASKVAVPGTDRNKLRKEIVDFRAKYPSVAGRAAALFTQLPSPLDQLRVGSIPPEERFPWQPKDLVAVLGYHGGHRGPITSLGFSPDGSRLLSSSEDNTQRLWDIETGKELRRFDNPGGIQCFDSCFSPDGRRVLSGGADTTMRLWDLESGRELHRFAGHSGRVWGGIFLPDGRRALSLCQDWILRLWDLESGEELQRFQGLYTFALCPDGRRVLAIGMGHTTLLLWDLESGKEVREIGRAYHANLSPDGRFVLGGGEDGTVQVWDLAQPELKPHIFSKCHNGHVHWLIATPDGKNLVTSGNDDGRLILWDFATGERVRQWQWPGFQGNFSLAPDGRHLAAGNENGRIYILRIAPFQVQVP